jgi:hypothetical protein
MRTKAASQGGMKKSGKNDLEIQAISRDLINRVMYEKEIMGKKERDPLSSATTVALQHLQLAITGALMTSLTYEI